SFPMTRIVHYRAGFAEHPKRLHSIHISVLAGMIPCHMLVPNLLCLAKSCCLCIGSDMGEIHNWPGIQKWVEKEWRLQLEI
ncbi:MAG TPA: hypothetical protein PLW81_04145, partial [Thiobacillaceae bacterium]|nr:hypothetical protein [Thiobacillaceae bacterium]